MYAAVQENPQRTVAVKLMRAGVTSRSALRRFEFESQLLAQLRHPGIAQVYEAGIHESDDGPVPYFAMELVPDAKPITAFADAKDLNARKRMTLFRQVCDAVEHGHQRGIIHRDLKPGNILVDTDGQVKIIDFGVARSTDSDLAVTTMGTDVGQIIGTLQYMSPEQCEADPTKIDKRCDIYALGVVLFELLCGELPYDLTGAPIHEAARIICEQSPTQLSTISRKLRGDIETIVAKALEKDRERRYSSAATLGTDLARYLSNEPIMARRPTITYRTSKFLQKRKLAFVAGLALAAALALAGYSQLKARHATALAAMQTAQRLYFEAQLDAHRAPDRAIEKYDEAIAIAPDYVQAQVDRAYLLNRTNRGDEAEEAATRIIELYPDQAGPAHFLLGQINRYTDPDAARFHRDEGARLLPDDKYYRALALDESESRQAIELLSEIIDADPLNFGALWQRAGRYKNVRDWQSMLADATRLVDRWPTTGTYWAMKGVALGRLDRYLDAVKAHTEAVRLRPNDPLNRLNRAEAYYFLAFESAGEALPKGMDRAIAECTKAIELNATIARAYTLRAQCHLFTIPAQYELALRDCRLAMEIDPDDSYALRTLGHIQIVRREFDGARESFARAMPDDEWYARDFHLRARIRQISGNYDQSLEDHDRAVALRPDHSWFVAGRAVTRRMNGDKQGAIKDFEKAVALDSFNWELQGNLLIWDVSLTDGATPDTQRASAALLQAEAVAMEEAEQYPFSPLLTDLCAGRRDADQVLADTDNHKHRSLVAYFGGVKALSEGRSDDAATWFESAKDTPGGQEIFVELAQWQLARLTSN